MTDPDTLTAEKLATHNAARHDGCSGNCNQGRKCTCCADLDGLEFDDDPCAVSRRGVLGLLVFLAAFWLSVGAAVYVAVH